MLNYASLPTELGLPPLGLIEPSLYDPFFNEHSHHHRHHHRHHHHHHYQLSHHHAFGNPSGSGIIPITAGDFNNTSSSASSNKLVLEPRIPGPNLILPMLIQTREAESISQSESSDDRRPRNRSICCRPPLLTPTFCASDQPALGIMTSISSPPTSSLSFGTSTMQMHATNQSPSTSTLPSTPATHASQPLDVRFSTVHTRYSELCHDLHAFYPLRYTLHPHHHHHNSPKQKQSQKAAPFHFSSPEAVAAVAAGQSMAITPFIPDSVIQSVHRLLWYNQEKIGDYLSSSRDRKAVGRRPFDKMVTLLAHLGPPEHRFFESQ
ncbi:unnamed protein product [Protopolystoma xenopodis]|uniref:Uncharacterized protein n=1 Tax=Protopolystoma xenopodis TaxID=117903 RepID=A0A3S5A464_9PLAT|nr:unnamed protein product [Protopolystoma xenopodis]